MQTKSLTTKTILSLFLLSHIAISEEVTNDVDLECAKKNQGEDYYFYNYLISLNIPNNAHIHFHAVKYDFRGETLMHLNRRDESFSMRISDSAYTWHTLPEFKGTPFRGDGSLTWEFENHLDKPHVTYTLNRENLNLLADSSYLDHEYNCKIISNLDDRKSYYLNEFNTVKEKNEEAKTAKSEAQLKKNKI